MGPLPLRASRGCIRPQVGGCHGLFPIWGATGFGVEAQRPIGPPLLGGGRYTLERLAGGIPYYSLGSPPGMAPLILGVSLVIRYRSLPNFRTFLGGSYREPLRYGGHPGEDHT